MGEKKSEEGKPHPCPPLKGRVETMTMTMTMTFVEHRRLRMTQEKK
jgi:hypothetical protein